MTTKNIFASFLVVALLLVAVACGPTTYVQSQPVNGQYDPGYNPNNVVADAIITAAIINGVNGYYDSYHHWYPSVMYGGVPGYYVGGVFHTSTSYKTTIVNNYNHDRVSPPSKRNVAPVYSSGAGASGRGASNAAANKAAPTYSSGAGSSGRGSSSAPSRSYGSSSGSSGRGAVSAPSRSYSSGAGSSGRRR